jgi:hypothetical protein
LAWTDYYRTVEEQLAMLLSGTEEDGTEIPGHAVGGHSVVREVTLSLDTSQYADGDVLADTQEIASALRISGGSGILHSVTVLDKDDQGEALDLLLLNASGSIGTENAAVSVSDAVADTIMGVVEVAAGDFVDLVNSQIAAKTNLGIVLEVASGSSLYVAAISRGTGTYTTAGITLKLGIIQD